MVAGRCTRRSPDQRSRSVRNWSQTRLLTRRARCLVVVLLACATLLTMGCGKGSSVEAQKTAAFVALANRVCRELPNPSVGSNRAPDARTDTRKLLALEREDRNLPSLHKFRTDVEARRKLREEFERAAKPKGFERVPLGSDPIEKEYRLGLKVYADEKALGMTACAIPPRAPIGG
jgi:hypothetical protein